MRIAGLLTALLLMAASLTLAQSLSTPGDSLSYAIGVKMAASMKNDGFSNIDEAIVARAIVDVLQDRSLALDQNTATAVYRQALQAAREIKNQDVILAGQAYLSENGRRAGVTTTSSGLQYEVLRSGDGASPRQKDKVTTHYHGTLIDGKVFDSSVDRGEPISFSVGGVIKGWQEALQLMQVGDKWRIVLPYDLAYGERGAGSIPPYSTLIFEVELLGIN